jgi:hypothetical protein
VEARFMTSNGILLKRINKAYFHLIRRILVGGLCVSPLSEGKIGEGCPPWSFRIFIDPAGP